MPNISYNLFYPNNQSDPLGTPDIVLNSRIRQANIRQGGPRAFLFGQVCPPSQASLILDNRDGGMTPFTGRQDGIGETTLAHPETCFLS